ERLSHPHEVVRAERVTEDGRKFIRIELAEPGGRLEFWFDTEAGYLVRKSKIVPAGTRAMRYQSEVKEFLRLNDGTSFPVVIELRGFEQGELAWTARRTLTDVRLNESISPNDLRLPNITGTLCTDYVRLSQYPVDADGNPAGPESPGRMEDNSFVLNRIQPR